MIVCNGQPFIEQQIRNVHPELDELVIVEGADAVFSQLIGSHQSTDETVSIINELSSELGGITLIQNDKPWRSKNDMVRAGYEKTSGDIYNIDVDEFLPPELIRICFDLLSTADIVNVPERWYYKWTDVFLSSNQPNHIRLCPARFYNRPKNGLVPSHIPYSGYRNSEDKFVPAKSVTPNTELYGYHYLAILRSQLEIKMKYYCVRGDCMDIVRINRLSEFDSTTRYEIGTKYINTYKGKLLKDNHDYIKEKFGGLNGS